MPSTQQQDLYRQGWIDATRAYGIDPEGSAEEKQTDATPAQLAIPFHYLSDEEVQGRVDKYYRAIPKHYFGALKRMSLRNQWRYVVRWLKCRQAQKSGRQFYTPRSSDLIDLG